MRISTYDAEHACIESENPTESVPPDRYPRSFRSEVGELGIASTYYFCYGVLHDIIAEYRGLM